MSATLVDGLHSLPARHAFIRERKERYLRLRSQPRMVLILPTPEGWKAELAGPMLAAEYISELWITFGKRRSERSVLRAEVLRRVEFFNL